LKKICLWSGPRNVSTALMYSFAQRADTRVVDEPLYGHYLRVSGAAHPGRDEVMRTMDCDGDAVMRRMLDDDVHCGRPILFMKQMAHHLRELDLDFLDQVDNVLLIRDPREMLPSLTIQLPQASLADTGLELQSWLLARLLELGGRPAVLDSRELLLDPEGVLRQLCDKLRIEFDEHMLHWKAEPRAEDGIWARHWYHAVHGSTGFAEYRPKGAFPDHLLPLLDECLPHYEILSAHAFRARGN